MIQTPGTGPDEVTRLREELAAAQRTNEVLMDRLEQASNAPVAQALHGNARALQEIVRQRTRSLEQMNEGLMQAAMQRKRVHRILREMQRLANIGGWELDASNDTIGMTEQIVAILQIPPAAELTVPSLCAAFAPADAERLRLCFQAARERREPFDLEVRSISAQASEKVFRIVGHPLIEAGEVARIYGVIQDITARKQAEEALERSNRQLVEVSRKAGMAEIATGVLHNVGNVLNSVNVSSSLVTEGVRKSKLPRLVSIAAMFKAHEADAGAFITSDPKGKLIPGFLGQLAQHLSEEQAAMLKEITHLQKNVEHIKEIVSTQQSYASGGGMVELLDVRELFQDAIRINDASLNRHGIELVRDFQDVPPVQADKHKVLQILVNLIRNARDAMHDSPVKRLTLRTAVSAGTVRMLVQDSGCGIPQENLTRIFAHGFTTKVDGHGFGLHSSANTAREMKGSLTVQSDGPGNGATFTLELPIARQSAAAATSSPAASVPSAIS